MIDKDSILKSISYAGSSSAVEHVSIANRSQGESLLQRSSGILNLTRSAKKKFSLVLGQPQSLKGYSNLEIRCCLCNRIVSYPAWYWFVRYAVNHFHYFICFDASNPEHATARCIQG